MDEIWACFDFRQQICTNIYSNGTMYMPTISCFEALISTSKLIII